MSFFENTRKPVGLGGKIMVAMMNFGHSAMAEWGLHFLQPAPDAMVLDCGCGGGANIKTLLKRCPKGKVQGIDYSAVSVEKARKVNAGAIAEGRCNVQQASVAELPFEAEQFDVVTAFETVYFWPELAQNFREVYRVLKPGGTFFICNEANGETAKDDKWTQIINGIYYEFTACPAAEFAIRNGLTEIMPALCNVDFAAMELLHARLVRTTTCANGCKCDYTICGDQDPYAKEHPEYRDEAGFRRNT